MKPKAIRSILALALLIGLVLAVAPAALAADTWTVDAALANDSGCVAPTFQCKTIGAAVGAAAANDTINVLAGTYVVSPSGGSEQGEHDPGWRWQASTIVQVSGTGYRFTISAAGVTLQDMQIEKTDKTASQNIIIRQWQQRNDQEQHHPRSVRHRRWRSQPRHCGFECRSVAE